MDKQKDPQLKPEDALKAENAYLKLKLGLEHGMQMVETSTLSPEVENQWLKSVYAFEQQFKDAKRTKLYDFIGRPAFRKWDTLTAAETSTELKRLRSIMSKNSIELGCICEYDDATIYRFITEELFDHEMDDMRVPGMTCHFTYEEFHPNHDYDLRKEAGDFVNAVFIKEWNEDYDSIALANRVIFSGKEYDARSISAIIIAFQEAHTDFKIEKFEILSVTVDSECRKADVLGSLSVAGKMKHGDKVRYQDGCSFHFARKDDFWQITEIVLPGLTTKNNH